ncbi:hypothetical protein AMS68_007563 [Peltaster fructicola]|uniref:Uncharacterized protein n=1 Tax=Peltaster fructicola TaxID=286661 RepID=A0A6H0Y504_9PEZI|nr:hypothetical protein AMS68_007563 [Peltaster fructicola]
MAGFGQQPPPPFTNDEKNYILAEVIKSASPPHVYLLDLCNRLNTQPRFDELPLPLGRSANACRAAFDEMRRIAYSPVSQAGGNAPGPLSAPAPSLKRPTGMEMAYTAGRAIAPKTSNYPYPASIAEPPLKRKRGRPTKAEQQARAAEQTGESSSLGGRFQTPLSQSMPPSPSVDTRPPSTTLPPTSRMPISAIVSTPTAPPKSASHSSSSSGKRRRRRRSEGHEETGSNQFTSPFARVQEDTPARPSASRRRDEPIHSSVARLGVSEPDQSPGASAPSSTRPGYGDSA